MKYSGIGGQAVMEGVMMRNQSKYALAVRLEDGSIAVDVHQVKIENEIIKKIPIIRGIYSFVESLILGIKTLMQSASYFEEEDQENSSKKQGKVLSEKEKERKEKFEMVGTLFFSIVIALLVFMILPFYLSKLFGIVISSNSILTLLEGIIRVLIFVLYVYFISKMEDIKRVFMYHGAEHKCINCIEHGMPLDVEHVKTSSRLHKRCGTSFIFFVFIVSIFVFMFIQSDSHLLQIIYRLLLVPLIAGISYEFIRLAGRHDNAVVAFFSKPGMWLQNLTTKEPDDEMIEVGIASVEAVFDWKKFQEDEGI